MALSAAENLLSEIICNNDCYSLKTLKINGNILKNIGITNGREIGETLNSCLEMVFQNPEKNREDDLINFVKKLISSSTK